MYFKPLFISVQFPEIQKAVQSTHHTHNNQFRWQVHTITANHETRQHNNIARNVHAHVCSSDLGERKRSSYGHLFDDADAVYAPAVPEIVTIRLRPRKGSPWAPHHKQRTSQKEEQKERERQQFKGWPNRWRETK